jgi:hypothetical protein
MDSMTLVSADVQKMNRHYTPVAEPIEERECMHSGPFWLVQFGTYQTRESMLARVLDEYKADALSEAEFEHSFFWIPYIYMRTCVTVTGIPMKLKGGS